MSLRFLLLCLLVLPASALEPQERSDTMASGTENIFLSGEVPIRYLDLGSGPAVVLIHGFTASADMWSATVAGLANHYRVIALDCRGHGQSGKPHAEDEYGVDMVDDVVRLMDRLQVDTAHVVGYSMGAEIALRFTTREPTRVLSLTMGGSGWSKKQDESLYRELADSLEKSGSFAPMMAAYSPEGSPPPSDQEIAAMDALLEGQDLEALVAVARAMGEIINLSAGELQEIRVPVLGISGENDPERGNLERMKGVVPEFSLTILEGRDHMSALEDPGFERAIVEFLERAGANADD